ncbi:hypothetical protein [Sphingobacterium humi]|uniref:Uncharacterized protein n=1 Tax=Sphingobacterium humi TaxID=1796905 RepID=A0A6N8L0B9_9SPHI|nr:hypothetical protein [Sphingobacterium humi]MVZ62449.1 hypothetical protein [Sphingobacterium humi]
MQKIIITYGTRPLAQRVAQAIGEQLQVQFATSEQVPSILQAKYLQIPTAANPTFAHELLKCCLDQQANYLLPLGFREMESLAEAALLFEEYGIQLLSPTLDELKALFVLPNPAKEVEIQIIALGKNLLNQQDVAYPGSGLLAFSDEGEEFALCTV